MPRTRLQENLQGVMDETGLSQVGWSKRAGLGDSAVKNVMQGKSKHPRIDTFVALAKAAGVPLARLISGTSLSVDSQLGADLPDQLEDEEFFNLWRGLPDDVKLGFLSLLRAFLRMSREKVG